MQKRTLAILIFTIMAVISSSITARAEDYNGLVEKNLRLRERLDSVISDYEGLKKRYKLLLEKIKSLQNEKRELIRSKEKLRFDLISKEKQIKQLNAQLKALSNRLSKIEDKLPVAGASSSEGKGTGKGDAVNKEEILQLKKDLIKAIEKQTGSSLEKSMLEDIIKELKGIINKQKRDAEQLEGRLKNEYLKKEKDLIEKAHALEEELLEAKASRMEIEEKLKTAQVKNKSLQEQLRVLKEEISARKKSGKLGKTEEEIKEELMRAMRKEFAKKERRLSAQIDELTEKMADVESKRQRAEERLRDTQKALKQAEDKNDKLERQIEIVRREIKKKEQDKCLEREETLSARIDALRKDNLALADEKDRQAQRLSLVTKKLTTQEETIQQLKAEIQQAAEKSKAQREKIKELKASREIQKSKAEVAEEKREQAENRLKAIEKQKQQAENELRFVRSGVEKQEEEIRKLKERLTQQRSQSDKIQADLEERLQSAQARISELEAELKKQYAEAKRQLAWIKQLEKEKTRLQDETNAALYAQKAAEMKKNVLEEKIKDIKQQTDKERLDMHYNLAVVYGKNGMYEDAEREYLKCLAINPKDADVHYNLAILYDDKLQENQKAIDHYKEFLELRPDSELSTQVSQWMLNAEQEIRLGTGPKINK